MQRLEIIHLADKLFEETVSAKSYIQVLQQFRENGEEFNKEMSCSPAFYNVVYNALVESLFLKLYKIYDWNTASLTIRTLLKEMQFLREEYLDADVLKTYKERGDKFCYRLSKEEEPFWVEDVEQTKKLCAGVGIEYTHTTVAASLQDVIQIYNKRFEKIQEKKIISNLIKRRNKIGVHNDAEINFDYKKINEEFPLADDEIEKLVDVAIEFNIS